MQYFSLVLWKKACEEGRFQAMQQVLGLKQVPPIKTGKLHFLIKQFASEAAAPEGDSKDWV